MATMMDYRRFVMGTGLHGGDISEHYQRVEYIGCTGTQYLATDYAPHLNAGLSAEWRYAITSNQVGAKMIFGMESSLCSVYAEYYENQAWYASNGTEVFSNVLSHVGDLQGTIYEGEMAGDVLTVDGRSANATSATTPPSVSTNKLAIFAYRNDDDTIGYITNGVRLYGLLFRENGYPAANFVPCYRKYDGEIGMYDTIGRRFYANAGTGVFEVGPNI